MTNESQELCTEQDAKRLAHLNTLFNIAVDLSSMWDSEHEGATEEEIAGARDDYFTLIFEPFWNIAKDIRLLVWVEYPTGKTEEDMKAFLEAYKAAIPTEEGMWTIRTREGYKVYRGKEEADRIAAELTYAQTEEDIQSYLDELAADDRVHYMWMANAAQYVKDCDLHKDRVSSNYVVYSVLDLKEALGKEGWIEFLTLLEVSYKVHPATVIP